MAREPKSVRGYSVCTEAWHAASTWVSIDGEIDQVTVGSYVPDGSCVAEFSVSWYQFDDSKPALMRLKVFDGSFQELVWQMSDLLEALALVDGRRISRLEFTALLDRLGFVDRTDRVREPDTSPAPAA